MEIDADMAASARPKPVVRTFASGASRDLATGKFDYDAFLSPRVIEAYATYMNFNRLLRDGTVRDGDNWQRGIPTDVYRKSAWRHFFDWWRGLRGYQTPEHHVWNSCGLLFNIMGELHEFLIKYPDALEEAHVMALAHRAAEWAKLHKTAGPRHAMTPNETLETAREPMRGQGD